MEVGTEISQKIRSAIKAKLMEIGSYVDDELPDYIMVMVANKKTQQQMSNDLSLFLGSNTDVFTTWLHGLLAKLQTVSGDSSKAEKSKSSKDKKRDKKSKEGVDPDSRKEKRKVSKKMGDGDSDAPKAKSARTTSTEKNGTDALQTKDGGGENITTNNQSSETEITEERTLANSKPVGDSKQDDIEDVRQLLVTETQSDELAEELEKSEEGIDLEKSTSSSSTSKNASVSSSLKSKDTRSMVIVEHERSSAREPQTVATSTSRKRKCPSSVVAAVRRDNDIEDDDDHSTPMVASVVKVTSRKSSVPQSMQANRALLVKAISEAERSIAVKRKIAVARPMSREESPSEIYTPKRRKSENTTAEVSPPPYIPSRKESSFTRSKSSTQGAEPHGSTKDARQLLEKRERDSRMLLPSRERRELISRSRRLELFHKLGIDRKEMPDMGERRVKDDEERNFDRKAEKEKSDVVRNFKITAHVAPSSRLSQAAKERLAKALEDKERQLKITVLPTVSSHKGSLASRLGKVVVHRRSSEDREQDLEPRNKSKTNVTSRRPRLALTLLGKEVVKKQCEAAVLSVKSSDAKVRKQVETMDSRVVESHVSSDEEDSCQERSSSEIPSPRKERRDSVKSERDSLDKDSEDLDDMLKDDIDTDLLNETLADEFTLDLDDDEDLIKVVGQLEEENILPIRDKSEPSSGTRFIVTLDGVDERQFEGRRENDIIDPGIPANNPSQLSSPILQHVPAMPRPPDPATFVLPSDPSKGLPLLKSAPPKIQPFSINLKDSDDEFEDKAETKAFSKMAGYHHQVKPVVTGIVDPTVPITDPTEGLTALQKAKLSERCKFWPACAAGAECKFHHPTSYCKTFPNCKFGDKCLFIHPNCKFDSKCTRIDCPFTHISRRPALGTSTQPVSAPIPIPTKPYYPQYIPLNNTPSTVCKFFPNCHNVNCSFIHPKPCRFGLSCQSPGCPFFHPSAPTKDKLKWNAQTNQVKETVIPSPTLSSPKSQTSPSAMLLAGSTTVSSTSMWLK